MFKGIGFPIVEAAIEIELVAVIPGEARGSDVGFATGVGIEVGKESFAGISFLAADLREEGAAVEGEIGKLLGAGEFADGREEVSRVD